MQQFKYLTFITSFFLAFCLGLPHLSFADDAQCRIASSAIRDASRIRGLSIRSQVPCRLETKSEVESYLRHTIKTKIPPLKLQMEALVFKTLGFLPADFDYEHGIVELYLSQIGGYYDPVRQRYVMAAWLPDMMQTSVAVHELTHALQDQHYRLSSFTDEKLYHSDQLLARSALIEGDATAVMLDYARGLMGQSGIAKEDNVEGVMMQNLVGASMATSALKVPQSLQRLLIFPYTAGLRFAHFGLKKNGYRELDSYFKKPPRSTEEILHPEKYYQQSADFVTVTAAEMLPLNIAEQQVGVESVSLYEDVMGEFAISVLLEEVTKDARLASRGAQGWGGDLVIVRKLGDGHAVIWRSKWDSEDDAIEFFEIFNQRVAQMKGQPVIFKRDGRSVTFAAFQTQK